MAKTITIIGAGMMGSALAFPARENGNSVRLVGTPLDREIIEACKAEGKHPKFEKAFPEGIEYFQFDNWKEAVKGCDFIIGGVSSFGVDWFLNEVLINLEPSIPVLSVTKGLVNLEDGSLISYPEYWQRSLAAKGIERTICAIGGPCTSYELVAHDQTEVAFCGKQPEVLKMMKATMSTDYYHIRRRGRIGKRRSSQKRLCAGSGNDHRTSKPDHERWTPLQQPGWRFLSGCQGNALSA